MSTDIAVMILLAASLIIIMIVIVDTYIDRKSDDELDWYPALILEGNSEHVSLMLACQEAARSWFRYTALCDIMAFAESHHILLSACVDAGKSGASWELLVIARKATELYNTAVDKKTP